MRMEKSSKLTGNDVLYLRLSRISALENYFMNCKNLSLWCTRGLSIRQLQKNCEFLYTYSCLSQEVFVIDILMCSCIYDIFIYCVCVTVGMYQWVILRLILVWILIILLCHLSHLITHCQFLPLIKVS